ncbi:hypothetical protein PG994_002682 [Apiospora phragmitis]|uniref:Uncharacterized protein n=1 Tax=Apiospora phragmitis TaxID=2905665 RepID=A0ABR1W8P7_9PEZI
MVDSSTLGGRRSVAPLASMKRYFKGTTEETMYWIEAERPVKCQQTKAPCSKHYLFSILDLLFLYTQQHDHSDQVAEVEQLHGYAGGGLPASLPSSGHLGQGPTGAGVDGPAGLRRGGELVIMHSEYNNP